MGSLVDGEPGGRGGSLVDGEPGGRGGSLVDGGGAWWTGLPQLVQRLIELLVL